MDIDATEEIWTFVSNYDLNGIIDCSNLSDLTNDEVYPKIIFYPNPANDKITLDSSFLVQEDYEIISLNGKSLIRGKLQPGRSQIEVSGLSRSIYILKGYAGTGKTTLISALVKSLPVLGKRSVLMAPTGRAAKVLSKYCKKLATTIHRKIYWIRTNTSGNTFIKLKKNSFAILLSIC